MPRLALLLLMLVVGVTVPAGERSRALATLLPPAVDEVRTLSVGHLTFLRSPLPPVPAGELDGLGTAAPCPPPDAPLDRVLYDSLGGGARR